MQKVAYISDPLYLRHETGAHPESPNRLRAIERAVEPLRDQLIICAPFIASETLLGLNHTAEHIQNVLEAAQSQTSLDPDTICSEDSYDAARMAVGAGIAALDGIKSGEFERAFCAVRPPGHHATPTQAMGFCLFNNIAIAARYAQTKGYEHVMIIDFDVHHGNGTQDAFYEDDSVFYFSSHQAFAYPGTGMESHQGAGRGEGFTANYLIMPDSGDAEILDIYQNDLHHHVEKFQPNLILVSAGYDLHESDPLAQLNVTTEGIRQIVRAILESRNVPFVFFLEGGYETVSLGKNVAVTLEELLRIK
jgi:acetoin utilization deacetylase AcuC-like enzyme